MAGLTPEQRLEGVRALFAPRNIAIVGASDRPGNWSMRVYQLARALRLPGPDLSGQSAQRDGLGRPDLLREPARPAGSARPRGGDRAGRGGDRHDRGGRQGQGAQRHRVLRRLRRRRRPARAASSACSSSAPIEDAGIAVSGPNCLGNLAAPHRMMTIPDDRITELERGPVAIVGQSGGIVMAIHRALLARGVRAGYAVTSGNEIGLNIAGLHPLPRRRSRHRRSSPASSSSIQHAARFPRRLRLARDAGKPVVAVKIGGSEESRNAALAHTGSLAGSLDCFDAVAETVGVIRVDTLDEMVESSSISPMRRPPKGPRLGAHHLLGRPEGPDAGSGRAQRPVVPAAAAGDAARSSARCSASAPRSAIRSTPASPRCRARRPISAASRSCAPIRASTCWSCRRNCRRSRALNNKVENLRKVDEMAADGRQADRGRVDDLLHVSPITRREFRAALTQPSGAAGGRQGDQARSARPAATAPCGHRSRRAGAAPRRRRKPDIRAHPQAPRDARRLTASRCSTRRTRRSCCAPTASHAERSHRGSADNAVVRRARASAIRWC